MDALQQRVEGELAVHRHGGLPIEDEAVRRELAHGCGDFGEVARQWLAGLGLQHHGVAVAEGQAPEAVPLRLEEPALTSRNGLDELRLHRRIRRRDRQLERRPLRPRARLARWVAWSRHARAAVVAGAASPARSVGGLL